MKTWNKLADKNTVEKTKKALEENGFVVYVVENGDEAKNKVRVVLPKGAEVINMSSTTLDSLKIPDEVLNSGNYDAVRNKLNAMDKTTQAIEMNRLGAAPAWAIGSVHAISEDGRVFIASNTGSQIPAYAYGALNVIWVVGTQKIVKNFDEAIQRLYEYSLPLESERAKKAYGVSGSAINKILVINKEIRKERIIIILVNEILGF